MVETACIIAKQGLFFNFIRQVAPIICPYLIHDSLTHVSLPQMVSQLLWPILHDSPMCMAANSII